MKTVREWSLDPRCIHGDVDLLYSRLGQGMGMERALPQPRRGAGKCDHSGLRHTFILLDRQSVRCKRSQVSQRTPSLCGG